MAPTMAIINLGHWSVNYAMCLSDALQLGSNNFTLFPVVQADSPVQVTSSGFAKLNCHRLTMIFGWSVLFSHNKISLAHRTTRLSLSLVIMHNHDLLCEWSFVNIHVVPFCQSVSLCVSVWVNVTFPVTQVCDSSRLSSSRSWLVTLILHIVTITG